MHAASGAPPLETWLHRFLTTTSVGLNRGKRVRTVSIQEVSIDSQGRLFVRPRLSASEDLRFIYRSATGVRW
jgi:hypothetical protein